MQINGFLTSLRTGEEIRCQLFSEPDAGSDLANVSTSEARKGDTWITDSQKVWTSGAQNAAYAILLARTDPSAFAHSGLVYFPCPINGPSTRGAPLQQITGEAEFDEVSLTDVRIPDDHRLGAVGQDWEDANTALNNERITIDGTESTRGINGVVANAWRRHPERRVPNLHDHQRSSEQRFIQIAARNLG